MNEEKGDSMSDKGFSIGAEMKRGWKTLCAHWGFFLGYLIFSTLLFTLAGVPIFWAAIGEGASPGWAVLGGVLFALFGLLIHIGLIRSSIKAVRGEPLTYRDLFSGLNVIIYFILGAVLFDLIIFFGFILLIIPGLMWLSRFWFWSSYTIEKKKGPFEALYASETATKGARWDVFLSIIIFSLLYSFTIQFPFAVNGGSYDSINGLQTFVQTFGLFAVGAWIAMLLLSGFVVIWLQLFQAGIYVTLDERKETL